jgi:predicted RNA-binding Zn ribbon-like protein
VARYPRLGLPVPLELVNTQFAQSGQCRDALATPDDLDAWLQANAELFPGPTHAPASSGTELEQFRALRDALRALCGAVAEGTPPPHAALQVLNDLSAQAPQFARLEWLEGAPHVTMVDVTLVGATPLAIVARAAIQLLAGPDRERISACRGPGCVLFFLKERRRRDWCSATCGNRARVARHYRRHRPSRDPSPSGASSPHRQPPAGGKE